MNGEKIDFECDSKSKNVDVDLKRLVRDRLLQYRHYNLPRGLGAELAESHSSRCWPKLACDIESTNKQNGSVFVFLLPTARYLKDVSALIIPLRYHIYLSPASGLAYLAVDKIRGTLVVG